MRKEQEMMDLILSVAKNDERIRAVYMNGSRTNTNVPKDIFQDYDIVYVVTETKSFIEDKNWISIFGELLILQEPDKNDMAFDIQMDFDRSYTFLMLFKDGNRIDLCLQTKGETLTRYLSDKLTVPLLDKDNCLPIIPSATDEDYWIKKPTELLYLSCCNEFWWCLQNVAKGIARDELPYVMWMFNSPVREALHTMIEWHIGVETDFSRSAGKSGKYFKKYLSPEFWDMYAKTYSTSDYNTLWSSIFTTCQLFRALALSVGKHFEFEYNNEEDRNMMEYLKRVMQMPENITDIL